jgi:hypothetical protein
MLRTGTSCGAHGIRSELSGATLAQMQEVAARLLPGRPRLSDLRWSSGFRIIMRLGRALWKRRRTELRSPAAQLLFFVIDCVVQFPDALNLRPDLRMQGP